MRMRMNKKTGKHINEENNAPIRLQESPQRKHICFLTGPGWLGRNEKDSFVLRKGVARFLFFLRQGIARIFVLEKRNIQDPFSLEKRTSQRPFLEKKMEGGGGFFGGTKAFFRGGL